jgi:hypothetical protein
MGATKKTHGEREWNHFNKMVVDRGKSRREAQQAYNNVRAMARVMSGVVIGHQGA